MLSREDNALITRTGPGTPGGAMMRRYWLPLALSEELDGDAPVPVRVLDEDLVLFRDETGAARAIARYCPHRRLDLAYGRLECGGIRCIYHGWLVSGEGRVLEQPGEPEGSNFKDRVRQPAYPCREVGGLVLGYLGPGAPPRLPGFPFFAPGGDDHVVACKLHHACNYLQGHEGNIDPQHTSVLHGAFSAAASQIAERNDWLRIDQAPQIAIEETGYGVRIVTARRHGEGMAYLRITNHVMPMVSTFPGLPMTNPAVEPGVESRGYQVHWHVPIDDHEHWKYVQLYRSDGAIDKTYVRATLFADVDADYRTPRTAANRYLQDREEMRRATVAGVGRSFFDHDKLAVEAQGRGPIVDRWEEHLGTTDRAIIAARRQLLQAVKDVAEGRDPLFVERGDGADALAEMVVRSALLPETVDPVGGWWREA